MHFDNEKIDSIILASLDAILPGYILSKINSSSPLINLWGADGILDSIQFVSFLLLVEDQVNENFNASIRLLHSKALGQTSSPFRTTKLLSQYILKLGENE